MFFNNLNNFLLTSRIESSCRYCILIVWWERKVKLTQSFKAIYFLKWRNFLEVPLAFYLVARILYNITSFYYLLAYRFCLIKIVISAVILSWNWSPTLIRTIKFEWLWKFHLYSTRQSRTRFEVFDSGVTISWKFYKWRDFIAVLLIAFLLIK
jgi:hypothetical protein